MTFPHLITVKCAETNRNNLSSLDNCKVNWNKKKGPFLISQLESELKQTEMTSLCLITVQWTETNRMTFPHLITAKWTETNRNNFSSFDYCKVNWNRNSFPPLITVKWTETDRNDFSSFDNCKVSWNKQTFLIW